MLGQIVILNGVPRAGKSSIAKEIQDRFDGPWLNLGLDAFKSMTSARYQPGIGLRPGGEAPHLEDFVVSAYAGMYEAIAAHSRLGLNVVTDDGIHDSYSKPRHILADCAKRLAGLPVLFVGVRCTHEEVIRRRAVTGWTPVPTEIIHRFDTAIHAHKTYDLEVDTSRDTSAQCAEAIRAALRTGASQCCTDWAPEDHPPNVSAHPRPLTASTGGRRVQRVVRRMFGLVLIACP